MLTEEGFLKIMLENEYIGMIKLGKLFVTEHFVFIKLKTFKCAKRQKEMK